MSSPGGMGRSRRRANKPSTATERQVKAERPSTAVHQYTANAAAKAGKKRNGEVAKGPAATCIAAAAGGSGLADLSGGPEEVVLLQEVGQGHAAHHAEAHGIEAQEGAHQVLLGGGVVHEAHEAVGA